MCFRPPRGTLTVRRTERPGREIRADAPPHFTTALTRQPSPSLLQSPARAVRRHARWRFGVGGGRSRAPGLSGRHPAAGPTGRRSSMYPNPTGEQFGASPPTPPADEPTIVMDLRKDPVAAAAPAAAVTDLLAGTAETADEDSDGERSAVLVQFATHGEETAAAGAAAVPEAEDAPAEPAAEASAAEPEAEAVTEEPEVEPVAEPEAVAEAESAVAEAESAVAEAESAVVEDEPATEPEPAAAEDEPVA